MNDLIEALYVHIPFCSQICLYCDFYKMIATEESKEKYINYLIKELEMKKDLLGDLKSIYIGGGTPSSLNLVLLEKLLLSLSKYSNNLFEYTFEANVNDITDSLIELLKKYKINRISLGLQSFNENKINFLRRNHTKNDAIEVIKKLKNSNFNLNCDIIYGINNNDLETVLNDLDILIDLNVNHISTYSLILEEKTILYDLYLKGEFNVIEDDYDSLIYESICTKLYRNNYNHYEISNFCLENFESFHNLIYWNNKYYLGIGANSSYYYNNTRFTNINNLNSYYQGIDSKKLNYKEETALSIQDKIKEEVMLGLRKLEGININNFYIKYKTNILNYYPNINNLIKKNILIIFNGFIRINPKFIYMQNRILLEIYGD